MEEAVKETRVFPPPARFRIIEEIVEWRRVEKGQRGFNAQIQFHALCARKALQLLLSGDRRTLIGEHLSRHVSADWR